MSDSSQRLGLPYILPMQAQKHVTHNEALRRLDAVVQLTLSGINAVTPPTLPAPGETYALGSGALGVWAGQDGKLATWDETAWTFITPLDGWLGVDIATSALYVFSAGGWQLFSAPDQNTDGLGIGTSWDATNRLAVTSEATLFSHAGAGHQVKVNKANASETASLMFQTNWTGHAEMGLAGNNDFAIKVSPDGGTWTTALSFDQTSGVASGAAVQSGPQDVTPGRLARADYAYAPGNLVGVVAQAAGLPTGAVLERGSNSNGDYLRLADGTQVCWKRYVAPTHNISTAFGGGYISATNILSGQTTFAASFAALPACFYTCTTSGASTTCIVGGPSTPTRFATSLYAMRGTPITNAQVDVSAVAVGRWF